MSQKVHNMEESVFSEEQTTPLKDFNIPGSCSIEDSSISSRNGPKKSRRASLSRDQWDRKCDFLLSLIGYAVGLGNLWRFPYLCMRNGGGAFLIPFLFFLITCGLPLFFAEITLGQFSGRSTLHAWCICPLFKGIGYGMVAVLVVMGLYYNVIIAWTIYFLGNSFQATLPWTTCNNPWNTGVCGRNASSLTGTMTYPNGSEFNTTWVSNNYSMNATWDMNQLESVKRRSPMEEFWQFNVLQISSGFGDIGSLSWYMSLASLAAWLLVFLCIMKGVRSVGKVVYVTALMPYLLLTVLLIQGIRQPGAIDGIIYYLKPDIKKIVKTEVWVEAALQVFYSLGPGWGPLISMASHNKFNNNVLRDAIVVTCTGEGTSIFSGFVVFTVLGYMAHELQMPIEDVVKSGPGLGFVVYPEALALLPVQQLWAILFFFMLLTVGLDSQFCHVEAWIAGITDTFTSLRRYLVPITALVCAAGFVITLPFVTEGGIYIFQLVDWYVASICIPVFGVIECFIFGWIYGVDRLSEDVRLMLGRGIPAFFRICICIVTPITLTICFVSTMITYRPPTYGDYEYPAYAQICGFVIAFFPVLPIPIAAVHQLMQYPGHTLKERIRLSLRPSEQWRPSCPHLHEEYAMKSPPARPASFLQSLKRRLLDM